MLFRRNFSGKLYSCVLIPNQEANVFSLALTLQNLTTSRRQLAVSQLCSDTLKLIKTSFV